MTNQLKETSHSSRPDRADLLYSFLTLLGRGQIGFFLGHAGDAGVKSVEVSCPVVTVVKTGKTLAAILAIFFRTHPWVVPGYWLKDGP